METKEKHDELGLVIGQSGDGTLLAGIIFVQHGMTNAEKIEDCKPVIHITADETETLGVNLIQLAHDIRQRQAREAANDDNSNEV